MKQSKRQLIDNSLFLYGGLVAFALTGIAFLNLKNTTSLLTLILFLPVSLYFFVRFVIAFGKIIHRALNSDTKRQPYFGNFSLSTFLRQTETSFLINLFLIALALTVIFFRISLSLL